MMVPNSMVSHIGENGLTSVVGRRPLTADTKHLFSVGPFASLACGYNNKLVLRAAQKLPFVLVRETGTNTVEAFQLWSE